MPSTPTSPPPGSSTRPLPFRNEGETAVGRKGDSWHLARVLLEEADPGWANLIASGLHSGEGLIAAVRDEMRALNRKGEEVITDPGVPDKRLFVVESEFSGPLKLFRQERKQKDSKGRIALNAYQPAPRLVYPTAALP